MKKINSVLAIVAVAIVPVLGSAAPVFAASAHNLEAGTVGAAGTKNPHSTIVKRVRKPIVR